jgi:outer membrane protein with beta-barrel domain
MLRSVTRTGLVLLFATMLAAPASAQIVQGLHVGGGVFFPRGYDGRVAGDVLVEDLNSLAFKIGDFTSGQVFGEWLIAFGPHVEASAGLGYYQGSTSTVYADLTHPNGTEIEQELRLRMAPITAMVRFLPIGRPSGIQPYVGIGLSALPFRYSEAGEFVDYSDFSTFRNRYVATGTAIGPVWTIGARFPIKGDIWGLTTEWRYQLGSGDTGGLAKGFLNDKIDLSGSYLNFGMLVRF